MPLPSVPAYCGQGYWRQLRSERQRRKLCRRDDFIKLLCSEACRYVSELGNLTEPATHVENRISASLDRGSIPLASTIEILSEPRMFGFGASRSTTKVHNRWYKWLRTFIFFLLKKALIIKGFWQQGVQIERLAARTFLLSAEMRHSFLSNSEPPELPKIW